MRETPMVGLQPSLKGMTVLQVGRTRTRCIQKGHCPAIILATSEYNL